MSVFQTGYVTFVTTCVVVSSSEVPSSVQEGKGRGYDLVPVYLE